MSYRKHDSWEGWWTIDYRVIDHIEKGGKQVKTVRRERKHMEGTEEEAADYERRLRGLHVSKCRASVSPPFKEIAAEFKTWCATNNKSEKYIKCIGWNLNNLLPVFGIFPPSRITDPMIEEYKKNRKHVPVSCNQEMKMLKIIINWGANPKRNYCKALPFKIEYLQVFKKLPQPPSPDQFDLLMDQITGNFKQARSTPEQQIHKVAMVLIMYETGMRWIECRNLEWQNLRKDDGRLYLGRTKTNKARYTFVSPEVVTLLEPISGEWKKTGPMFINPRTGKIYTTMGKSLRNAAKAAAIPMRGTHTLRHALGTDSVDASGDIQGTSLLLGHADIKTTTIYTHTAIDRIKRLLDGVASYRKGKRHLSIVDNHKIQEAA